MAGEAGLMAFTRYVGGSSGTSLVISMWERRADLHTIRLYEQISPANPVFLEWQDRLTSVGLDPMAAIRLMQQKVQIEANTLGANDICILCAALFGSMIGLVMLSRKSRRQQPVPIVIE